MNVGNLERVLRIIAGLVLISLVFFGRKRPGVGPAWCWWSPARSASARFTGCWASAPARSIARPRLAVAHTRGIGVPSAFRRTRGVARRQALCTLIALFAAAGGGGQALAQMPPMGDFSGYERLNREQVLAQLARATATEPADFYSKNLSGLKLAGVDFKHANLTAAVLNGTDLSGANLSGCNLTVSFAEHANLRDSNLRGAVMFSMQLRGADLRGADLTGGRFIGDLQQADLRGAHLANLDGAADMKNQSMGLMHAVISSANLSRADLHGADLSRADFSFSTLDGADLRSTRIFGGDFSGASLAGADMTDSDLRESKFIDTDFSGADLTRADLSGSVFRNPRGLDTAKRQGAHGLP